MEGNSLELSKEEKARIVAFARLMGASEESSDSDIIEKYSAAYEEALRSFAEPIKDGPVTTKIPLKDCIFHN